MPVIYFGHNLNIIVLKYMLLITDLLKKVLFKEDFHRNFSISNQIRFGVEAKPIVVWNVNEICNMSCPHCYASAKKGWKNTIELSNEEAKKVIDKLYQYGIKILIFSGGEPLLRKDLFGLIQYAKNLGFQCHLSTNGVLITKEIAKKLKELNISYVGVSIDGLPDFNDSYRGLPDAFKKAKEGLEYLQEFNIKTGIRITLSKKNQDQLFPLIDFAIKNSINRFYISHLLYSGRGTSYINEDLSIFEVREIMNKIFDLSIKFIKENYKLSIVSGGNDVDGAFLILYIYKKFGKEKALEFYNILEKRKGNTAGEKIINIDHLGNIHPDQFWRNYTMGNILNQSLEEIFQDPLIQQLKEREKYLYECKNCFFLKICRGSHRERALFIKNDLWAKDPACYLTEEERNFKELFQEVKV